MTFAANVIGKRARGRVSEYWIGDGVYGALNVVTYENGKPRNVTCEGEERFVSTLFGPTADALDVVAKELRLPELAVDDWLVFEDMGSYTSACGTSFNGFVTSEIPVRLVYSDVEVTTTSFGEDCLLLDVPKKKVIVEGDHEA